MHRFIKKCYTIASVLVTIAFMFIPESLFGKYNFFSEILTISDEMNIIINRILFLFCIVLVSIVLRIIWMYFNKKYIIKGKNYIIQIEYGDITKTKKCKRVISFDECYTTKIGSAPSEIKPTSICGQYLQNNQNIDINKLINDNKIKPASTKSKFENKIRYNSGTIVPNGDDLLLAFARLDKNGRGTFFDYQEFLDCLEKLWIEIDKYFAQKDVCISILGSGQTRINDNLLTQQELLDIIIMSYKLSNYKIKKPYKLRIICQKNDDFSLNKIEESL